MPRRLPLGHKNKSNVLRFYLAYDTDTYMCKVRVFTKQATDGYIPAAPISGAGRPRRLPLGHKNKSNVFRLFILYMTRIRT